MCVSVCVRDMCVCPTNVRLSYALCIRADNFTHVHSDDDYGHVPWDYFGLLLSRMRWGRQRRYVNVQRWPKKKHEASMLGCTWKKRGGEATWGVRVATRELCVRIHGLAVYHCTYSFGRHNKVIAEQHVGIAACNCMHFCHLESAVSNQLPSFHAPLQMCSDLTSE